MEPQPSQLTAGTGKHGTPYLTPNVSASSSFDRDPSRSVSEILLRPPSNSQTLFKKFCDLFRSRTRSLPDLRQNAGSRLDSLHEDTAPCHLTESITHLGSSISTDDKKSSDARLSGQCGARSLRGIQAELARLWDKQGATRKRRVEKLETSQEVVQSEQTRSLVPPVGAFCQNHFRVLTNGSTGKRDNPIRATSKVEMVLTDNFETLKELKICCCPCSLKVSSKENRLPVECGKCRLLIKDDYATIQVGSSGGHNVVSANVNSFHETKEVEKEEGTPEQTPYSNNTSKDKDDKMSTDQCTCRSKDAVVIDLTAGQTLYFLAQMDKRMCKTDDPYQTSVVDKEDANVSKDRSYKSSAEGTCNCKEMESRVIPSTQIIDISSDDSYKSLPTEIRTFEEKAKSSQIFCAHNNPVSSEDSYKSIPIEIDNCKDGERRALKRIHELGLSSDDSFKSLPAERYPCSSAEKTISRSEISAEKLGISPDDSFKSLPTESCKCTVSRPLIRTQILGVSSDESFKSLPIVTCMCREKAISHSVKSTQNLGITAGDSFKSLPTEPCICKEKTVSHPIVRSQNLDVSSDDSFKSLPMMTCTCREKAKSQSVTGTQNLGITADDSFQSLPAEQCTCKGNTMQRHLVSAKDLGMSSDDSFESLPTVICACREKTMSHPSSNIHGHAVSSDDSYKSLPACPCTCSEKEDIHQSFGAPFPPQITDHASYKSLPMEQCSCHERTTGSKKTLCQLRQSTDISENNFWKSNPSDKGMCSDKAHMPQDTACTRGPDVFKEECFQILRVESCESKKFQPGCQENEKTSELTKVQNDMERDSYKSLPPVCCTSTGSADVSFQLRVADNFSCDGPCTSVNLEPHIFTDNKCRSCSVQLRQSSNLQDDKFCRYLSVESHSPHDRKRKAFRIEISQGPFLSRNVPCTSADSGKCMLKDLDGLSTKQINKNLFTRFSGFAKDSYKTVSLEIRTCEQNSKSLRADNSHSYSSVDSQADSFKSLPMEACTCKTEISLRESKCTQHQLVSGSDDSCKSLPGVHCFCGGKINRKFAQGSTIPEKESPNSSPVAACFCENRSNTSQGSANCNSCTPNAGEAKSDALVVENETISHGSGFYEKDFKMSLEIRHLNNMEQDSLFGTVTLSRTIPVYERTVSGRKKSPEKDCYHDNPVHSTPVSQVRDRRALDSMIKEWLKNNPKDNFFATVSSRKPAKSTDELPEIPRLDLSVKEQTLYNRDITNEEQSEESTETALSKDKLSQYLAGNKKEENTILPCVKNERDSLCNSSNLNWASQIKDDMSTNMEISPTISDMGDTTNDLIKSLIKSDDDTSNSPLPLAYLAEDTEDTFESDCNTTAMENIMTDTILEETNKLGEPPTVYIFRNGSKDSVSSDDTSFSFTSDDINIRSGTSAESSCQFFNKQSAEDSISSLEHLRSYRRVAADIIEEEDETALQVDTPLAGSTESWLLTETTDKASHGQYKEMCSEYVGDTLCEPVYPSDLELSSTLDETASTYTHELSSEYVRDTLCEPIYPADLELGPNLDETASTYTDELYSEHVRDTLCEPVYPSDMELKSTLDETASTYTHELCSEYVGDAFCEPIYPADLELRSTWDETASTYTHNESIENPRYGESTGDSCCDYDQSCESLADDRIHSPNPKPSRLDEDSEFLEHQQYNLSHTLEHTERTAPLIPVQGENSGGLHTDFPTLSCTVKSTDGLSTKAEQHAACQPDIPTTEDFTLKSDSTESLSYNSCTEYPLIDDKQSTYVNLLANLETSEDNKVEVAVNTTDTEISMVGNCLSDVSYTDSNCVCYTSDEIDISSETSLKQVSLNRTERHLTNSYQSTNLSTNSTMQNEESASEPYITYLPGNDTGVYGTEVTSSEEIKTITGQVENDEYVLDKGQHTSSEQMSSSNASKSDPNKKRVTTKHFIYIEKLANDYIPETFQQTRQVSCDKYIHSTIEKCRPHAEFPPSKIIEEKCSSKVSKEEKINILSSESVDSLSYFSCSEYTVFPEIKDENPAPNNETSKENIAPDQIDPVQIQNNIQESTGQCSCSSLANEHKGPSTKLAQELPGKLYSYSEDRKDKASETILTNINAVPGEIKDLPLKQDTYPMQKHKIHNLTESDSQCNMWTDWLHNMQIILQKMQQKQTMASHKLSTDEISEHQMKIISTDFPVRTDNVMPEGNTERNFQEKLVTFRKNSDMSSCSVYTETNEDLLHLDNHVGSSKMNSAQETTLCMMKYGQVWRNWGYSDDTARENECKDCKYARQSHKKTTKFQYSKQLQIMTMCTLPVGSSPRLADGYLENGLKRIIKFTPASPSDSKRLSSLVKRPGSFDRTQHPPTIVIIQDRTDNKGRWNPKITLTTHLDEPRQYYAAATIDDTIYVSGGVLEGVATNTLLEFNIRTNQWHHRAPMQKCRHCHGMVSNYNCLIVAGGKDQNERWLLTCEIYDKDKDQWSWIPALDQGHLFPALAVQDDNIWVIGGFDESGHTVSYVASGKCGTFLQLEGELPASVACMTAFSVRGAVHAVGGLSDSHCVVTSPGLQSITAIWRQGPAGWDLVGHLRFPRHSPICTVKDATMIVAGGYNSQTNMAVPYIESYNLVTGEYRMAKHKLPEPVFSPEAVLVYKKA